MTTKKMLDSLIEHHYVEAGTVLDSNEIRTLYKAMHKQWRVEAKAWHREIAIKDMTQYVSLYNHDIESILVSDYFHYDTAEANNHWCAIRAIEAATKLGITMTEEEFGAMADTVGGEITAEIAVLNYINSKTKKETKTMNKAKKNNDCTMSAENIGKLAAIISKYDVFAEFIDDYEQYGAATEQNDMVAADFVNTACAMGFSITHESFDDLIARLAKQMPAEDAIKEYLTAQNANNIKEEKKMSKNTKSKNDYTMGGTIEATNWTEFKAVCKTFGINCGTKTFKVLEEELKAAMAQQSSTVHDDASVVAEQKQEKKDEFVLSKKHGDAIVRRIMLGGKDRNGRQHTAAAFKASKSKDPAVNGHLMVTMSKLYAIIADVYGLKQGDPGNDAFIKKGVINYLCKNGWLAFKRYDSGALSFFPTTKMVEYKFQ